MCPELRRRTLIMWLVSGVTGMIIVSAVDAQTGDAPVPRVGVLALSGGIRASIRLQPGNCTIGPGNSLTISDVSGGGWSALFLFATDPRRPYGGRAEISLEGTGYTGYTGAVDVWKWKAGADAGTVNAPSLKFGAKGASGRIVRVLTVSLTDNAPPASPVDVNVSWDAGACRTQARAAAG
jgi:hypothetical protein